MFADTSHNIDPWLATNSSADSATSTTQKLNDLFGNSVANADQPVPHSHPPSTTGRLGIEPTTARSKAALLGFHSEQSREGLTWREAVRRLNELGIQEFRLEPGRQLGDFYFACEFTPHRDARVTRRFEAEATEPLLAVQAVLRQIDEWLTRR